MWLGAWWQRRAGAKDGMNCCRSSLGRRLPLWLAFHCLPCNWRMLRGTKLDGNLFEKAFSHQIKSIQMAPFRCWLSERTKSSLWQCSSGSSWGSAFHRNHNFRLRVRIVQVSAAKSGPRSLCLLWGSQRLFRKGAVNTRLLIKTIHSFQLSKWNNKSFSPPVNNPHFKKNTVLKLTKVVLTVSYRRFIARGDCAPSRLVGK